MGILCLLCDPHPCVRDVGRKREEWVGRLARPNRPQSAQCRESEQTVNENALLVIAVPHQSRLCQGYVVFLRGDVSQKIHRAMNLRDPLRVVSTCCLQLRSALIHTSRCEMRCEILGDHSCDRPYHSSVTAAGLSTFQRLLSPPIKLGREPTPRSSRLIHTPEYVRWGNNTIRKRSHCARKHWRSHRGGKPSKPENKLPHEIRARKAALVVVNR